MYEYVLYASIIKRENRPIHESVLQFKGMHDFHVGLLCLEKPALCDCSNDGREWSEWLHEPKICVPHRLVFRVLHTFFGTNTFFRCLTKSICLSMKSFGQIITPIIMTLFWTKLCQDSSPFYADLHCKMDQTEIKYDFLV